MTDELQSCQRCGGFSLGLANGLCSVCAPQPFTLSDAEMRSIIAFFAHEWLAHTTNMDALRALLKRIEAYLYAHDQRAEV